MTEKGRSTSTILNSSSKNNQNVDIKRKEKVHKREKSVKPLTKVVIRKLPPTMTEEEFLKQIEPLPEHDSYYFVPADWSLGFDSTSRAYINFINQDDIYLFKDRFDGYVFVDQKGVEYPAIVEFAPFQGLPKKCRKKDQKCNTIETDPHYLHFLEKVDKENNEPRTESKLEYSFQIKCDKKITSTPLLQYLASRKQEKKDLRKQRIEQKKRQREDERKKKRIQIAKSIPPPIKEEETKVSILKNYHKERNSRDRGFDRRDKGKFDDIRKEKRQLESDQKRKNDDRVFTNQNRASRRSQDKKFEQNKDDIQNSSSISIKTNQNQKNSDINKSAGNNTNKNTLENKSKKSDENNVKDNKSEKYKSDDLKERKDRKLSSGSDELGDNVREFFTNVVNLGPSSSVKKSNSSSSLSSTTVKTILTSKQDSHDHSKYSNTTKKNQDETIKKEKNQTIKNDNMRKYENRSRSDDVNREERSARRIRNKDRPSIEIYQPGKMRLSAKKDENNSSNLSGMKHHRNYFNESREKEKEKEKDDGVVKKKVSKYSERRLNRAKEREKNLNNEE